MRIMARRIGPHFKNVSQVLRLEYEKRKITMSNINKELFRNHVILFQRLLKPLLLDYIEMSQSLALAVDWRIANNIHPAWFLEVDNITYNGVSLLDIEGNILSQEIGGYNTNEERIFFEALAAQQLMRKE
jgi:hypothetical protein